MPIFRRLAEMARNRRLAQQLREIERAVHALPITLNVPLADVMQREMSRAELHDQPHLYGTPPERRHLTWGSGTDIGLERMRSDNAQVRMRGVALWLTAAYFELRDTRDSHNVHLQRQVLALMRHIKERGMPRRSGRVEWHEDDTAVA